MGLFRSITAKNGVLNSLAQDPLILHIRDIDCSEGQRNVLLSYLDSAVSR